MKVWLEAIRVLPLPSISVVGHELEIPSAVGRGCQYGCRKDALARACELEGRAEFKNQQMGSPNGLETAGGSPTVFVGSDQAFL